MKKKILETDQNNPVIQAYKAAVEKGSRNQHVLPRGSGWIVKRADSDKVTQVFSTQREATSLATTIAKNQGTAVIIHGSDGRVRDRIDY